MARHRSPNYPVVNLQSALEYLDRLHQYSKGRHPVPVVDAINEAWGMKPGSAYGLQVVAALKSFGLIEDKGSLESRQIQISELGAKIRGGHNSREQLIKEVALMPPLHRELWDTFSKDGGLPPQATLRQYLLFDREGHTFNEAKVSGFIEEFEQTVSFAKLAAGDIMDGVQGDRSDTETDDNQPPPKDSLRHKAKARTMAAGTKEDVFSLDEGAVVLTWPERLSKASAEDLKDWLELIGRKIKRAVDADPPADDADGDE